MKSLSRVRPSATPWTAAYQAPPSMGFSRQEYWSGVPLPSLELGLLLSNFLGKRNQGDEWERWEKEERMRERRKKKLWDPGCNSSWSSQTPCPSQLMNLSVPPFRFKPIWVGFVPNIGCVLTNEPCHWVIVQDYLGKGPKANVKLSACRVSACRPPVRSIV